MNGKSKVLADETFCFISLFTEISWWDLIASNRLVCVYDIDKENVKMKESNNVCPFMAHFYVMFGFFDIVVSARIEEDILFYDHRHTTWVYHKLFQQIGCWQDNNQIRRLL